MSKGNSQSKFIYFVSIVAALGGFLFGYDTAVIAGAIGFIQTKFGLSPALVGWAASSAIWGCIIGAFISGYISDLLGRKKVLMVTGIFFAVSAILSAIPTNLTQFILARMIGGIGVGAASMLSPLYISEIAPANRRGRMVTLYQLAIVIGINVVYFINLIIASTGSDQWNIDFGWRYMLGSELIPAVLFIIMLIFVPESPRWLMMNNKKSKVYSILNKINRPEETTKIIQEINQTINQDSGSVRDLFSIRYRLALFIGIILALFSQITGINAIIYYAPEIFKSVGFGTDSAMMQTVIIGFTNTIFTFVAINYIDKLGRRKLLLWGVTGMMVCLFGVGAVYYFELINGPLLLLFILGFIASFAMSMGPVPWVIMSEIFPSKTRGLAMSLATFVLWIGVVIITQLTPILLSTIGGAFTFWVFGINALFLLYFIYRYIPETKEKSLEEIEEFWINRSESIVN